MREVIDIAAVFPLRQAAVVVPTAVPAADPVRVADEERPYTVRDAEVDDFARGLVSQIAHAPFGPAAHLVLGALELLPALGMLFAAALLFGELAELLAALPLEGANAAPSHNESLAGIRRDGRVAG